MMVLQEDRERVQALLKDTITLLCKNGLQFKAEFSIEALIGITLDKDDVFLVNINEVIKSDPPQPAVIQHTPEVPVVSVPNVSPTAHKPLDNNCNRRKRSRPNFDSSQSGADEDSNGLSKGSGWSQSDTSAAMSGMDDSNSRLSQDSDGEPSIKHKANNTNNTDVIIKEETVECFDVDDEDEDDADDTPQYQVSDVEPKVEVHNDYATTGVWPTTQQFLSLQEQYRAVPSTVTNDQDHDDNQKIASDMMNNSQMIESAADLTVTRDDIEQARGVMTLPTNTSQPQPPVLTTAELPVDLSESIAADLSMRPLPEPSKTESANLTAEQLVQSKVAQSVDLTNYAAELFANPMDLLGQRGSILMGNHGNQDMLSSLCKQLPQYRDPTGMVPAPPSYSSVVPAKVDDSDHPYKCDTCGKRYMKRDGLVRHWKSHDTSLHPCRRCTLFFQNSEQLQHHLETRHGPDNLKHICMMCGKRFDRPQLLRKHCLTRHEITEATLLQNPHLLQELP